MKNEKDRKINKSSISQSTSYEEIGEFWDEHSLADYWEQTQEVEFEIKLKDNQERVIYYGIDEALSKKITAIAKEQGISAQELVNLWLTESLEKTL